MFRKSTDNVRGKHEIGDVVVKKIGLKPQSANAATNDEQLTISTKQTTPRENEFIRTKKEETGESVNHTTRATGEHDSTQFAEAASTYEVDDLLVGDDSKGTGVVPRKIQAVSVDANACQGQDAVVGSGVESNHEAEQPPGEQEPDDTAESLTTVEPLVETIDKNPVDHTERLDGEEKDLAVEDLGDTTGADVSDSHEQPQTGDAVRPPAAAREKKRSSTSQYSAPAGGPPSHQRSSKSQTRVQNLVRPPAQDRPALIAVRVIFQRDGHCSVSLLPSRLPSLPEELVISGNGGDVELLALQEQWYQDVTPENLAELLRRGVAWKDLETGQDWKLTGREVFVLAPNITHRGFVSCPRLVLGRSHVVLCTETYLSSVEEALSLAGCVNWTQLGENDGVPTRWRMFRNVVPKKPVPQNSDSDILNILRPRPEIEIAMERGIRLTHNTWLIGYPPAIYVYGDPAQIETVLIDGKPAAESERDGYKAPGWDEEGDHQVWCSDTNRSYSLAHSEPNWTYWPAYSLEMSSSRGNDHKFEICGPLVRPIKTGGQWDQRQVVPFPATNPLLLGASPGEVFFASPRMDLRGAQCLGLPPFDPVWALPLQPLLCDKRANRILLVEEPGCGVSKVRQKPVGGRSDLERWCQLILDANRKGLAVEPANTATDELWREYKQFARCLWKRLR